MMLYTFSILWNKNTNCIVKYGWREKTCEEIQKLLSVWELEMGEVGEENFEKIWELIKESRFESVICGRPTVIGVRREV